METPVVNATKPSRGPIIAFPQTVRCQSGAETAGKHAPRVEQSKVVRLVMGGKTKTKERNNWEYFVYCFGNINSVVALSHAKKIIEILIERDRLSETKRCRERKDRHKQRRGSEC